MNLSFSAVHVSLISRRAALLLLASLVPFELEYARRDEEKTSSRITTEEIGLTFGFPPVYSRH